jgi:hypothetical protein
MASKPSDPDSSPPLLSSMPNSAAVPFIQATASRKGAGLMKGYGVKDTSPSKHLFAFTLCDCTSTPRSAKLPTVRVKPKVYLETTIPGLLTAWSSRGVLIAERQQVGGIR